MNSSIDIAIVEDGYKAVISTKPSPFEIDKDELLSLLSARKIVYGIKHDVVELAVLSCNQGTALKEVVIAEGIKPEKGQEASIDFKFELSKKPKVDDKGRVDYREISMVINVKSDQLLAVKRKMIQPTDGITVRGEKITFPQLFDIPLTAGNNIHLDEQENSIFFRSASDGALRFENNILSVNPALEIADDVDFNVGNIRFKGEVKIHKDILPDFIVEAMGDLNIYGSAIACKIKSEQNITVRSGIVGKNKGVAVAKGNIEATFVENSSLKAGGDIIIKNGIIGSVANCEGHFNVLAPRAKIVGSTVRGSKGITTYDAGSRFDSSTKLITGINPEKENVYMKVQAAFEQKIEEVREIERKYGKNALQQQLFPPAIAHQGKIDAEKWKKLRLEIKEIYEALDSIKDAMFDHNCTITVKGILYPRVQLKIGKYELTTSKEYSRVTVQYSEDEDRLLIV